MITFLQHLAAALRGRLGQSHVAGVVADFERGVQKLEAAERHLVAEGEANATRVDNLLKRDAEIAKQRVKAARIAARLREFI